MKRTGILALVVLALASVAIVDSADAARLGGGRSMGAQRQSVAPPSAPTGAAANPVMPAQPGAVTPKPAMPAAAPAPAASGMSRWLAPIAGIAAGLGLAALLSHFGLSEGFASVLLLALVAFGAVVLLKMLFARRTPAPASAPYAGGGASAPRAPIEPLLPRAEPAAPSTNFAKPVPAGFDTEGFLREAKVQYRRLQSAWDAGDRRALKEVMTPEMASGIGSDLDARGAHVATEVVSLHAELLEVTTEAGAHWASVRFTGVVREDGEPQAVPLDEVWNLTKPVDGSTGWLLAGIRQVA